MTDVVNNMHQHLSNVNDLLFQILSEFTTTNSFKTLPRMDIPIVFSRKPKAQSSQSKRLRPFSHWISFNRLPPTPTEF